MKRLLIFVVSAFLLAGCGGGSSSNSGSGSGGGAGGNSQYKGTWDVNYTNRTLGDWSEVYVVKSDGSVKVTQADNCSGGQTDYQITNGMISINTSYTCTFTGIGSCRLTDTGAFTFTSASMVIGTFQTRYNCSGDTATTTITATGTKR